MITISMISLQARSISACKRDAHTGCCSILLSWIKCSVVKAGNTVQNNLDWILQRSKLHQAPLSPAVWLMSNGNERSDFRGMRSRWSFKGG